MPDLGPLHPQVVHFVVALGFVGVALRLISLAPVAAWTRPAAAALLLAAALAGVAAVKTGDDAHERPEQIPGVRPAVEEHQELGEATRNWLLLVGALELAALGLAGRAKVQRGLRMASAAAGLVACFYLYEAAEHGGELVYAYAGGVGTRRGDADDVRRLLVAGLFHGSQAAREAGHPAVAARLTAELVQHLPRGHEAALLAAESELRDRNDPAAALATLDAAGPLPDDPSLAIRTGVLRAEALAAAGQIDSARAVLVALRERYPNSRRVADALKKLS
ncbi:MAG TPA: DUF2231 domain-containing protein [Gemmatimonadales bacterium]|jgi:uncharacterized membrane protein|nr:DUF2231 domain-containing protein [Gemmatimonadales bacterium]